MLSFGMSMNLQIPADLEEALRKYAVAQGLDPAELGLNAIAQMLQASASTLPAGEAQLLAIVNEGFSEEWWNHYHELIRKRQTEELEESERTELISLTDQLEAYGARRLEALVELAKIRGQTVESLMQQFEIRPYSTL